MVSAHVGGAGLIRRAAQLFAVLGLVVACLLSAGVSAQAVPSIPTGTDCLHPPDPVGPETGVSAWIDRGPDKPLTGDPFAPRRVNNIGQVIPSPSIYDVYGYAGTTVVRYDDGCGSVLNGWNDLTNIVMGATSVTVATATALYRVVLSPTFGSFFEPMQKVAQRVIGHGLFFPFIGLTIAATALYYAARAHKADVAGAATGSGKALLIAFVGFVFVVYPFTIGATIDRMISSTVSAVSTLASGPGTGGCETMGCKTNMFNPEPGTVPDTRAPADMLAGAVHRSVLYNTWANATFGTGTLNAKVADEFGPTMFKAAAYTRAEQRDINAHPEKAKPLADLKREQYKRAAKKIEDRYPDVYAYVAGNRQGTQFGYAVAGLIAAVISVGFLLYALFQMAYAMILTRIAVGVAPGLALVAAFPKGQHLVATGANVVIDAFKRALYFGVGAILFVIIAIGETLAPSNGWTPAVRIFILLALTYTLWKAAKKFGIIGEREKAKSDAKEKESEQKADQPGPSDVPGPRDLPVDAGFIPATPVRPAAIGQRAGALGAAATVAGARAVTAGAVGGAKGAVRGGAKGLSKGAVFTAATAGLGVGAVAGSTAKGVAAGGAVGAAKGAGKSGVKSVARQSSAAVKGIAAAPAKAAASGVRNAGVKGGGGKGATAGSANPNPAKSPTSSVGGKVVFHPPGSSGRAPGPASKPIRPRRTMSGVRVFTVTSGGKR